MSGTVERRPVPFKLECIRLSLYCESRVLPLPELCCTPVNSMPSRRAGKASSDAISSVHKSLSCWPVCIAAMLLEIPSQPHLFAGRYQDKTPELETLERRRPMPLHLHINVELLKRVHLIAAVLLENLTATNTDCHCIRTHAGIRMRLTRRRSWEGIVRCHFRCTSF